jgi:hypothetical protein
MGYNAPTRDIHLFPKEHAMKTLLYIASAGIFTLLCSCAFVMNGPEDQDTYPPDDRDTIPDDRNDRKDPFTRKTAGCFPFEDNTNRWYYTESGGNHVNILVTDTISDDGITYFRVSFREEQVDTTDDWFKRSSNSIYFSSALIGKYDLFLPAKIDSARGSFASGYSRVSYTYNDSLTIGGTLFHGVITLDYATPFLHGFTTIVFAESIGIVQLVDETGRWPITYRIDSCNVSGEELKF